MRLPRGYTLTPRALVLNGDQTVDLAWDLKVARWRVAYDVLRALSKIRVSRRRGRWVVSI